MSDTIQPTTAADVGEHACLHTLDRRAFLQRAALSTVAALIAGGLVPSLAMAEDVAPLSPRVASAAARSYDIPAQDGVYVDAASELAIARVNGKLLAFSLACPHRGATLQWRAGEGRFDCPKHKARFLTDGAHASGRATSDLDRFALQRVGHQVRVMLDRPLSAKADPVAWDAAVLVLG
jgi:nitrite reductase/ring-hydroxylating ferredoxin subunit